MTPLAARPWLAEAAQKRIAAVSGRLAPLDATGLWRELDALVEDNHRRHDREAFNLNPASNVMGPRAERLLCAGLGPRASLGQPGDKYETGLEAIEQIEVLSAQLACDVFDAAYAELRVPSGALANLYVFMATCSPGDAIIAPPPAIGGHVTHHADGAAGLYQLQTLAAPVDAANYSVDVDGLRRLARSVRPRLITLGGSLNLWPHPVAAVREICDEIGARLMFDAAHLSGMVAGCSWRNPLDDGAHVLTMSTYKSLGGPPGGLIVTRDASLAQRLDAIAYPGLTANADAGRIAALAATLIDWTTYGRDYARTMVETARALAAALDQHGLPVHHIERGATRSHQFALQAAGLGGGQAAARRLGAAGLLACGIGLPLPDLAGDLNGLRLGTPEIVRVGLQPADMPRLAALIAAALDSDADNASAIRAEIAQWRRALGPLRYVTN
jgi:glycine hydroxymethyltransferase